jgi:NADPH:quinone reductase-like Zn-dependent oxidoreductase
MKALVLEQADGLDSAAVGDVETPQPAAGEVRVALRAAALNHRELWITRGMYPGMQLPTTMGADGAGIVDAVGEGVDAALVGKEVVLYPAANWGSNQDYPGDAFGCLGMPYPGTIAEYICVAADNVVAKPAHLDMAAAAAVPLAGLTAWRALTTKARMKAGDNVLVTGIGGGVATWALTFAKTMGANVFVTSSSGEKIDWAVQAGASGGVNYKEEKWGKALGAMSGGIDVVIDGAPANSVSQYGRTLRMGARVVIYGSTGGMSFEMGATDLFLRHATLYGSAMGSLEDFRAMMDFVAKKKLQPAIDRSFSLAQASEALHYLEREHSIGKVVITV